VPIDDDVEDVSSRAGAAKEKEKKRRRGDN
jgi:hypothetical protein